MRTEDLIASGVERVLELRIELAAIMQQLGAPSLRQLTPRWCAGHRRLRR